MESSPCRENWNLSRTNLHVNCTCYLSCFFPLSPRARGRQTLGDHEGVGHGCVWAEALYPRRGNRIGAGYNSLRPFLWNAPSSFVRWIQTEKKKKAKMKGFSFYVATREGGGHPFDSRRKRRQAGGVRLPYSDVTPNRVGPGEGSLAQKKRATEAGKAEAMIILSQGKGGGLVDSGGGITDMKLLCQQNSPKRESKRAPPL